MKLNAKDKILIEEAKKVVKVLNRRGKVFHSSVGCALVGDNEKMYLGVNMASQASSPVSLDAEQVAIVNGYMNGLKKIESIVAIHIDKLKRFKVLHPCGECREFMRMFGNPWVIISLKKKVRLKELLPY